MSLSNIQFLKFHQWNTYWRHCNVSWELLSYLLCTENCMNFHSLSYWWWNRLVSYLSFGSQWSSLIFASPWRFLDWKKETHVFFMFSLISGIDVRSLPCISSFSLSLEPSPSSDSFPTKYYTVLFSLSHLFPFHFFLVLMLWRILR